MAVLLGLANIYVVGRLSEGPISAILEKESEVAIPVFAACAVVAGLASSEVVLRSAQPLLWGGFFDRYIFAVLTACLGGLIFGALLPIFLGGLLPLVPLGVGVGVGMVLGTAEGLVLAFPLAAVLGLFGSDGSRPGSSSRP